MRSPDLNRVLELEGTALEPDKLLRKWRQDKIAMYQAKGCKECDRTGYKGRLGLYEVLSFSDEIRDMILSGSTSIELKRKAVEEGMLTLRMSGLRKVKEGLTTIEEVARETVK